MFVKSLLASSAVAASIALGTAGSANADPTVDFTFGIGIGSPGYHGAGFYDPFFDPPPPRPRRPRHHFDWDDDFEPIHYGISCGTGRNIVRGQGFRGVRAYDCSAPTYGYQGWRDGEIYRIKVSSRGRIIDVDPIY